MYAMDMRQYDPAIARWVVQDPITHHYQSPYNGFDGNPVYWADPSGGSVSDMMGNDMNGNQRYNQAGLYIPIADRNRQSSTKYMGGGNNVSYGRGDNLGSWEKHKVGNEVISNKDIGNDTDLEGFTLIPIYQYEFVPNNRPIDDFMYGFMNAKPTNFRDGSVLIGYAGLHLTKYEYLIKGVSKGQNFSAMRNTVKTLRGLKTFGRGLGYLGTAVSVAEDISNNNVGAGTAFKVGIGLICTINPVFGLGYAVFDLAWGAATGTTFTDSVANGIDNAVKNN